MKTEAVEFLTTSFRDQDLLDAIQIALEKDYQKRRQDTENVALRSGFDTLTPSERPVLPLVSSGLLNKQNTAAALGTTETTVKVHRANVMRKMSAESLADLVGMADRLGLPTSKS